MNPCGHTHVPSLGKREGDRGLQTDPLELEDSPRRRQGQRQVLVCRASAANTVYWLRELLDAIMGSYQVTNPRELDPCCAPDPVTDFALRKQAGRLSFLPEQREPGMSRDQGH